jgi:pimeloyl-ACP methyl ester carboxylesterase
LPDALNLATGRRTIAFSRFGHGHSAAPPRPRTPAFFHEEALAVLPELFAHVGVHEPVLVGHSDGASIALIHAAHHRVSGLVLLAPHVFVEDVTVDEIRRAREEFLRGGLRERMARHHDDPEAAFWGWCGVWLDPAFQAWTLEDEAVRLTAPTLLIQGADDPYGSLAQLDRIETAAPGAVTRLVLPGGHSPHLEHPQRVVGAIAEFVAALPRAGSPRAPGS